MVRASEKCYTPPVARTCNRMRLSPGPHAEQRHSFQLWKKCLLLCELFIYLLALVTFYLLLFISSCYF